MSLFWNLKVNAHSEPLWNDRRAVRLCQRVGRLSILAGHCATDCDEYPTRRDDAGVRGCEREEGENGAARR